MKLIEMGNKTTYVTPYQGWSVAEIAAQQGAFTRSAKNTRPVKRGVLLRKKLLREKLDNTYVMAYYE